MKSLVLVPEIVPILEVSIVVVKSSTNFGSCEQSDLNLSKAPLKATEKAADEAGDGK